MEKQIKAPYFKIESFGAVDGPGIRLVLFLQGCPYRCLYCHNPESWKINGSKTFITPSELIERYRHNESYYKNNGGITLSGGEPLIHMDFCLEVCKLGYENNINIALDTSGATFNLTNLNFYKKIIKYKPLWLVDIKHINPKKHKGLCGVENQNEINLIKFLEKNKQHYWIRQVLLPGYTDDPKDLEKLGKFLKTLKYNDKFELQPYHTMGVQKYDQLKMKYRIINVPEPSKDEILDAIQIITSNIKK